MIVANIVFDSSVLLALLKQETYTIDLPDLRWASMSAVNVAEVWTKLAEEDRAAREAGTHLIGLLRDISSFTPQQARLAGELQTHPGVRGLSLGDRACFALALTTGAQVYTADKVWSRVHLPCSIHQIR